MSERDGYPSGVPCWVTTMQPDPDAAVEFYAGLFGWEPEEGGGYYFARMRGRQVAAVAPLPPGVEPAPSPAWVTAVRVDSADKAADRAREAGGTVVAEAFDGPTGRMAVVADPAGAVISVIEPGSHNGAQLVNEPGAWAMSSLQTPDVEGAKGFYAALFGWTTESFQLGDTAVTMFRLPGYEGGEPEQPVSREVVATMMEGEPAGWGVDFWVHDVDAAAARAEELNGRVVAPPFDLPIGRTAVLADPAGVVFSVSRMGPA